MATAALDLEKRLDKRRKDRDLQNEPDDPAYNGRNDFIYQLFIMGCIYLLGTASVLSWHASRCRLRSSMLLQSLLACSLLADLFWLIDSLVVT